MPDLPVGEASTGVTSQPHSGRMVDLVSATTDMAEFVVSAFQTTDWPLGTYHLCQHRQRMGTGRSDTLAGVRMLSRTLLVLAWETCNGPLPESERFAMAVLVTGAVSYQRLSCRILKGLGSILQVTVYS